MDVHDGISTMSGGRKRDIVGWMCAGLVAAAGLAGYEIAGHALRRPQWWIVPGRHHVVPGPDSVEVERVDHTRCALAPGSTVRVKGSEPQHGVFVAVEAVPAGDHGPDGCSAGEDGFVVATAGDGPFVSDWPQR